MYISLCVCLISLEFFLLYHFLPRPFIKVPYKIVSWDPSFVSHEIPDGGFIGAVPITPVEVLTQDVTHWAVPGYTKIQ